MGENFYPFHEAHLKTIRLHRSKIYITTICMFGTEGFALNALHALSFEHFLAWIQSIMLVYVK